MKASWLPRNLRELVEEQGRCHSNASGILWETTGTLRGFLVDYLPDEKGQVFTFAVRARERLATEGLILFPEGRAEGNREHPNRAKHNYFDRASHTGIPTQSGGKGVLTNR